MAPDKRTLRSSQACAACCLPHPQSEVFSEKMHKQLLRTIRDQELDMRKKVGMQRSSRSASRPLCVYVCMCVCR